LPGDSGANLDEMFADINSLPQDDPLRAQANGVSTSDGKPLPAKADLTPAASNVSSNKGSGNGPRILNLLPQNVLTVFHANRETSPSAELSVPKIVPAIQPRGDGGVIVDASHRVAVPSFEGASLRIVVERADGAGLRVQPVGSGLAREQVPAAGTMVPAGTEVVVRFAR
jgi:cell division protein FtsI (penicillin-binding protein 3)